MDLSRKRDRDRLARRHDPYWQRLTEGAYLGFRRGPDTWIARWRGGDKKQQYLPLGDNLEFDQAKEKAEDWFEQLGGSATRTVKRDTVKAGLETYLKDLKRHGREGAAAEAEWRYKTTVYNDKIAAVELETATKDDFLEWRDRLIPGRANRTVNRYVRALTAGLNRAHELGHVGTPIAWALTALADDVEDEGNTAIFLTPEQRTELMRAATQNTADFLRSLELTGARPHEMAVAKVGDFDGKRVRLAHRKGKPPKLRVRYTTLSSAGVAFFEKHAKDKLPTAPLFTEDGINAWKRHRWGRAVRAAVTAYNEKAKPADRLPSEGVGAYAFRHARISELLQIHQVDPLTVAHQTGTSLAMIEKTYFKFIPKAMTEKLEALKSA